MISADIPLNQGCLAPIQVVCPEGTILTPSITAATVGCTTETSSKIADLVFKAFKAAAASQGTMNNLTFGYGGTDPTTGKIIKGFGYYETIAGGAGAGPDWDGTSGVHTHITNTRITDPEILEKRYPVILHEFSIRRGSGGAGLHRGGDGCVRDIEFRIPLQVSILSDRRVTAPYGMAGGKEGQRGENIWIRKDPVTGATRKVALGPRKTAKFHPGDHIVILTPGGGGWGEEPLARCEEPLAILQRKIGVAGQSSLRTQGSLYERNAVAVGN
jgi:5-oxoprolinase (ATP-hydrolysing)